MSSLAIYKDDYADSTVISNRFIDEYMTNANDCQLKVYLYLVRMMSANLPTGISDMADKFNHTEKDIMRALRYWEKCHLLALDFNDQKVLSGIHFLAPSSEYVPESRPLAPIVPLKLVSQDSEQPDRSVSAETAAETQTPAKDYSITPSYSRDELKKFKESPDTSQLLFVAESYLQKNLSLSDVETLYFIHYELGFTCELTDYLLQYCIDRGKKSFSYIKKVAISWAEAEITTPKQAKSYIGSSYDKNVYAIMKALGRTGTPTPKEADVISTWYRDYGFSMEVINEACGRTVLAVETNRLNYCDKILASWNKAGVKTLGDVAALDAAYRKPRATASEPRKNSFNDISKHDYDFDAIEKKLLGKTN